MNSFPIGSGVFSDFYGGIGAIPTVCARRRCAVPEFFLWRQAVTLPYSTFLNQLSFESEVPFPEKSGNTTYIFE